MTGKERLTAFLQKRPIDRLAWTTLADSRTLSQLPGNMKDMLMLDFCRYLGVDSFLLNGWGTPYRFSSPQFRWGPDVQASVLHNEQEPELAVREWKTPKGKLTGITRQGHPVKYPVDSIFAVRLYREMWEGVTFAQRPEQENLVAIERELGDDGVVTRFWGPSAVPRLLEEDMGAQNFYLLYHDHPEEMDGLIRGMHARELPAFEIIANGPWTSATLCENTSTFYISPEIYAKYNMPHQRDFVETMHRAGKPAILHMCGHVKALLPLIKETGCDGLHALTPPPTGDTPWEAALDVLGEDLSIISALPAGLWLTGDCQAIEPLLDRLITPRLRAANFVLGAFADGIAVPLERFETIKRWIQKQAS
ncbi:MAG: hypothetical protein HYV35_07705 [Lentisphaerae bacterium]|nr:hypothetical protein [Lentisphaerota bacterium]